MCVGVCVCVRFYFFSPYRLLLTEQSNKFSARGSGCCLYTLQQLLFTLFLIQVKILTNFIDILVVNFFESKHQSLFSSSMLYRQLTILLVLSVDSVSRTNIIVTVSDTTILSLESCGTSVLRSWFGQKRLGMFTLAKYSLFPSWDLVLRKNSFFIYMTFYHDIVLRLSCNLVGRKVQQHKNFIVYKRKKNLSDIEKSILNKSSKKL